MQLKNEYMKLEINDDFGRMDSLTLSGDALKTEFMGNKDNISYSSIHMRNQWTGDLLLRVWDDKEKVWTKEISSASDDIRRIAATEDEIMVFYQGPSKLENGIRSVSVTEKYKVEEDRLFWSFVLKNPSDRILEVGEVSLPFIANSDFTGFFEDERYVGDERWRGYKQKWWHEDRVQQHLSIDGSSSYIFLQRPKGDYPAVLFQILNGDKIEAAYQMDKQIGCQWSCTFEGPYYLSLYSCAARKCEGWKYETEQQSYWFNGNTSLILKPGEEREFTFVIHVIHKEEELKEWIYEEGQLCVDIQPQMAVPVGVEMNLRLKCKDEPELIPVANNLEIRFVEQRGDEYYYKLVFFQPGQKKLKVRHGKGDTVLLFYGLPDVKKLLSTHARFIVEHQYYENPLDPFGRHHAFLPYDDALEMIFTESEESWQVGALDEYALPVAMYVAEFNSIHPDQMQIDILEEYIEDCLYRKLQQRDTYLVRRGMYYEERTPSDIYTGNKWDKETAESTLRSFNYPLITDIYFAMYKIADKYGMTKVRSREQYLEMAYKTAMKGYELGKNKFNGAPAGATIIPLLEALKEEKLEWFDELNRKVRLIAEENAKSVYPFGSELYVDQTAHNQYEAMMRYYGKEERLEEAYRITYTLRIGQQPEWFLYGNEKRGNVCCWYGTPLNSRVLFEGFDRTGNINMLRLGFGGLFSFLTCIRSYGAAHGWFLWWPDRTGFDFRSLDTDMGMYGYLYAAKSYLVDDPIFGRCGYGCTVKKEQNVYTILPYDGLGIRFRSVPHDLSIEVLKGNLAQIQIDEEQKVCRMVPEEDCIGKISISVTASSEWEFRLGDTVVAVNNGKIGVEG
ncbi:MAG: DUF5695 domain-containing protein [Lachnospiraceae bacterium]|nr:DUF5695 domain-containing protein [Lachnospiraceae bacterium]